MRSHLGPGTHKDLLWCLLAVVITSTPAKASEPPTPESIRNQIQERWSQVRNMHIRLRQETIARGDQKTRSVWQTQPNYPKYCGTEDVLFAFDGEKRYVRVLGLDCRPLGAAASGSPLAGPSQPHDEARVWDKNTVRERTKIWGGRFHRRTVTDRDAVGLFPPPQYLLNIGFALPDPMATDDARDDVAEKWTLPKALEDATCTIAEKIEQIEGCSCRVLQRGGPGTPDSDEPVGDRIWLDVTHGLAVKKRELHFGHGWMRIDNDDFTEVLAGLWLPRRSRIEYFTPSHGSESGREEPVLSQTMTLACNVVNQVPAKLFDVALTEQKSPPGSLLEVVDAYHWLHKVAINDSVEEIWAAKGQGRRMELRRDSELLLLNIDTKHWSLLWRPALNRATLLPSRLSNHLAEDAQSVPCLESRLHSAERLTAMFRMEEGRLGDRKVDKLTAYFPADPMVAGRWPIHEFDPRQQSKVSGTDCRTRENWFDRGKDLSVHRRCGCETQKWERTVDFPLQQDVKPDWFRFSLPQAARLSASSDALKRAFMATQEEGKSER